MYEVRDPWAAEEWQQWEAERRALAQSLVGSEARAQVDEVVAARGLDPELAELLVTQALALAKGHMRVRAAGALDRRVEDDGEAAMPVNAEALEEIASVLLPLRAAKRKADEVKDNDDDEAAEARRQLEVQQQEAWQLVCSKTRKAKRREQIREGCSRRKARSHYKEAPGESVPRGGPPSQRVALLGGSRSKMQIL